MKTQIAASVSIFAAALLLSATSSTRADYIALSQPDSALATQGGGPYIVGNVFTVNSNGIYVKDLGIFASLGDGTTPVPPEITATNPVEVGIYHTDGTSAGIDFTTLNVSNTHQYGSTGMVVLNSFAPVYLAPGNYLVVASDVGGLPAQNTANTASGGPGPNYQTGGGLITIPPSTGTTTFYSNYLGAPAIPTIADVHLYTAGTFVFSATPEPSSFVLGGLGVAGLMLAVRLRRKAQV